MPPFDPDPLHVPEPEPWTPPADWLPIIRRDFRRPDGVPGPALVLAIVGFPLLACAAFAVWWLVR